MSTKYSATGNWHEPLTNISRWVWLPTSHWLTSFILCESQFACTNIPTLSGFASSNLWTIVGEWSNAPTDCAKWLNGRGVGARWDGSYASGQQVFGSCANLTGSADNFSSSYKTFLRKWVFSSLNRDRLQLISYPVILQILGSASRDRGEHSRMDILDVEGLWYISLQPLIKSLTSIIGGERRRVELSERITRGLDTSRSYWSDVS